MGRSAALIAAVSGGIGLMVGQTPGVTGHVYLAAPVSRNFYYTTAFQTWDFEGITYCPHCYQSRGPMAVRERAESLTDESALEKFGNGDWPLRSAYYDYPETNLAKNGNYLEPQEISVRHGICGDPEQTAAEGSNVFGRENSVYPVLETFEEGAIIEMQVVISTFHWGHLEYFICNVDDLEDGEDSPVTQECFNKHPLTRVEDDGDASPIDPNHPGRYYLDPPCRETETDYERPPGAASGYLVSGRYRLPEGLSCTRCVVQMIYYTGNSCRHPGYEEFVMSPPASLPGTCAPTITDWVHLDPPPCGDGFPYPEEFWNCADIAITPGDINSCLDSEHEDYKCDSGTTINVRDCGLTDKDIDDLRACIAAADVSALKKLKLRDNDFTTLPEDLLDGADKLDILDLRGNCDLTCLPIIPEGGGVSVRLSGCNSDAASEDCGPEAEPTPSPTAEVTPAPTEIHEGCLVAAGAYGQCGGGTWEGPTCCNEGYECTSLADSYSQCRPVRIGSCSFEWEQCGGASWSGSDCCSPGTQCEFRNEGYSQCIPSTSVRICATLLVPAGE